MSEILMRMAGLCFHLDGSVHVHSSVLLCVTLFFVALFITGVFFGLYDYRSMRGYGIK